MFPVTRQAPLGRPAHGADGPSGGTRPDLPEPGWAPARRDTGTADARAAESGSAKRGPAETGPPETALAETEWPPEGEGQLPFSLRIGVTGHRQLPDPAALLPAVRTAIQGVIERFLGPGAEPALLVVSALAEGADRLVATEVLAGPDATLEASLPLPPAEYLGDFTGDASKAEFTEMLGQAASVWVARPGGSRDEAYERAGRHVVDRADVLIALWDGEPPRGHGGTATVVSYAREQGVPVAWVPTSGDAPPVYWYDEDRAGHVEEAAREFREYNAAPIPEFAARARAERDRLEPAPADPRAGFLREHGQLDHPVLHPRRRPGHPPGADIPGDELDHVPGRRGRRLRRRGPGHGLAPAELDCRGGSGPAAAPGRRAAGQPEAAGSGPVDLLPLPG